MATVGRLMLEIGANVARMDRDMGKIERRVSRFTRRASGAFKILGATMVAYIGARAVTNAFKKVISLTEGAIEAAQEQEDAEITLATALGHRSEMLLEQASALQTVTRFGDETIIRAQALIAMFVKDEDQIRKATKATLDLAAAKGMKLKDAADLVSKTLGSTTNALSRYGIQVEGAVGSSERLESFLTAMNRAFGGQAEALAGNFRGRLAQVKNLYGDLKEELGYVITRNKAFIGGLGIVKDYLRDAIKYIKENRLWLMKMARDGFAGVIESIGKVIHVMWFFHDLWLGIRVVVKGTVYAIVTGLKYVYKALRAIMAPIDLLFRGLKALGLIDVNPFDKLESYFSEWQDYQITGMKEIAERIRANDAAYKKILATIEGFVKKVRGLDVAEIKVGAEGAAGAAGDLDKATESGKKYKGVMDSIWSATKGMFSLEGERDEYVKRITKAAGKQQRYYDSIWSATKGMLSLESERDALFSKTPKSLREIYDEYANMIMVSDNWIAGAKIGLQDFANDAARAGQMARDVVVHGIYAMEDKLVGFVKTGKIRFRDFANSVLEDISRIVMRMAFIQPLLSGLGFSPIPSAKGNVFRAGNIVPFDRGGVVTRPTIFPMKQGAGLMAEKGIEAVMPLTRTRGGDLGVRAEMPATSGPVKIEIVEPVGVPVKIKEAKGINTVNGRVIQIVLDALDRDVGGLRKAVRGVRA